MTLKMIEAFRNLRNKNGDNVRTIAVSKRSTNEEIIMSELFLSQFLIKIKE